MLVELSFYNIDHLGFMLQNTTVGMEGLLLVTRARGALHTWSTYSIRKRAIPSNRHRDELETSSLPCENGTTVTMILRLCFELGVERNII